jgi:heat shock protein HslJ
MPGPHATPTRRQVRALAAASVVLGCLAACSEESDRAASEQPASGATPLTPDAAALDSASLVSTSVEGHELAEGTSVRMGFEDDVMSVSGACNTQFGAYEVDAGVLRWSEQPLTTMMACDEELAAQDDWIRGLLVAGMDATHDGASLVLTSGEVTVELEPEPEADLETLLGRTWSVVGTISDGSTSRVPPRGRTPRLEVGTDGLARIDSGCNTGRTTVRVDTTSLTFGTPTVTRVACPEPTRTVEQIVQSVLDGRSDYLRYDGSVLILVRDGSGLVFSVR